jgi:para-aminobenzoate synthetase/4-amino-4-deoxychorismate lyase
MFYDAEQLRLSGVTGCDEAIFRNERNELTEGSRSNIFLRRGKQLVTPPVSSGLLPGILRQELLETGQCVEGVLTPDDLQTADEVFLGNSLRGLIRAEAASGKRVAV